MYTRWAKSFSLLLVLTIAVKLTGIDSNPLAAMLPILAIGLTGAFIAHLALARSPVLPLLASLGVSTLAAFIWSAVFPESWTESALSTRLGAMLGFGSLLTLTVRGARDEKERDALMLGIALVSASIVLAFFTTLTVSVFPRTLDAFTFAADGAFGVRLDYVLGRLLRELPWLQSSLAPVYEASLGAVMAVFFLQHLRDPREGHRVISSALTLTLLGVGLYFVFPVVGAAWVWPNQFPATPPLDVPLHAMAVPAFSSIHVAGTPAQILYSLPRNCMPSLHFGWALLVFLQTRGLPRGVRIAGGVWAAMTALATLGFGYHYFVDLIVAVPVTVAASALAMPSRESWRKRALAFSAIAVAVWLLLIRFGLPVLQVPLLPWLLAITTTFGALKLHALAFDEPAAAEQSTVPALPVPRALTVIFFVSGAAALIYEVVFARKLSLVFGNTATANTTVLTAYMGGMALGAWLGGRLSSRGLRPLKLYAAAEVAVGLYCFASEPLFDLVRAMFVSLAAGSEAGAPWVTALQFALGFAVLLPPTLMMGATLPLLSHELRGDDRAGRAAGGLYAVNTLGAALGALLTGYLLLPALGVHTSTLLAVAANLLAALLAFNLSKQPETPATAPEAAANDAVLTPAHTTVGLLVLGLGGVATLALESVATHLLATVVGSSVYAFTLMLFAFLAGLGGGSMAGNRLSRTRFDPLTLLGVLQAGIAASLLLGVFFWEAAPEYFAGFDGYGMATSFGAREFLRFGVCLVALLPPAFFIGASWPLAMRCASGASQEDRGRAVGRASALNTAGNIVGALLGGFAAIPLLGSLRSLQLVAAVAALLGLTALWKRGAEARRSFVALAAVLAVLFLTQPRDFDWTKLAAGSNVYFKNTNWGSVIAHTESLHGGITTVSKMPDGTRYLLTNGKFQGQWPGDETKAQYGFTLLPLLHTSARQRAAIIGYGTGSSAFAAWQAGFAQTDIIDLTPDIVQLADEYFPECNERVSTKPGARMHYTDGRNFLALSREQFDVVGLEINSIWFAGAGALYNREFYALVKSRLAPGGVLQQWVQLHHLSRRDLLIIFETIHREFDHVWLYFTGGQGVLVACEHDCAPTDQTRAALAGDPRLTSMLAGFGGVEGLAHSLVLSPENFKALREDAVNGGLDLDTLVSDDDNMLLEYATPRGNVREVAESGAENFEMLSHFSSTLKTKAP